MQPKTNKKQLTTLILLIFWVRILTEHAHRKPEACGQQQFVECGVVWHPRRCVCCILLETVLETGQIMFREISQDNSNF